MSKTKWRPFLQVPNELTICLGIIEEYNTFSNERNRLVYEILQAQNYQWVFDRGRPEEGYGRRILLWTTLDDPEYVVQKEGRIK